jgi:hypothetical protein
MKATRLATRRWGQERAQREYRRGMARSLANATSADMQMFTAGMRAGRRRQAKEAAPAIMALIRAGRGQTEIVEHIMTTWPQLYPRPDAEIVVAVAYLLHDAGRDWGPWLR